jgi:hypothetical protein
MSDAEEPPRSRARSDGVRSAKIAAAAGLIGAVIGALGAGLPAMITSANQITAEDVGPVRPFALENGGRYSIQTN